MIENEEEKKRRLERARELTNAINQSMTTTNYSNDEYVERMKRAREITESINPTIKSNEDYRSEVFQNINYFEEVNDFKMEDIDNIEDIVINEVKDDNTEKTVKESINVPELSEEELSNIKNISLKTVSQNPQKQADILGNMKNIRFATEEEKELFEKEGKSIKYYEANKQLEEKNNKNIFLKAAIWLKDFAFSLFEPIVNAGYGIADTISEGIKERTEMLDNMNKISNFEKGKLFIQDVIQDTLRSNANTVVSIGNSVVDFFTKKKDFFTPVRDFSVLNDSESYGDYASTQDLTEALQEKRIDRLTSAGIYNPSANKIGGFIGNVALTVFLIKSGVNPTTAIVVPSTVEKYGETGSLEEASKTAVSNYVFSKVLNSNIVKNIGSNSFKLTEKEIQKLITKFPELINTPLKEAIAETLPSMARTFSGTAVGRIASGEFENIIQNGAEGNNLKTHFNIIADSLMWATIYAGINGATGVNFKLNAEKLNSVNAKKQVSEWYKTLGLDENKEYTADEIKKQYRNLVKEYHSDITGGSDETMININLAYEGLENYLKNGDVYKISIETEPTNTKPEGNINNENGLIVKDDGSGFIDSNIILNKTAQSIANSQIQSAIVPITDNNGAVEGFERVQSIPIEVENSKLPDVEPAIAIDNNNNISIIDTNTGTKLLTGVENVNNAIDTVTETLQSSNNTKLDAIKQSINKAKVESEYAIDKVLTAIKDKYEGITNSESGSIEEELAKNNLLNGRENVQNENIDVENNEAGNLPSEKNNSLKSEFYNETKYLVNDINKITNQIKDNKTYELDDAMESLYDTASEEDYTIYDIDGNPKSVINISYDDNGNIIIGTVDYDDYYNGNYEKFNNSIVIKPNKNDKFLGKTINNAIKQLAQDTSNIPISGQMDIEGNEVGHLKKSSVMDKVDKNELSASIQRFKNATDVVRRQDVINIAQSLNVYHRGSVFIDDNMQSKSGNNKNPKLTIIDEFIKEFADKEDLRKKALKYAMNTYKNKAVLIKDMRENVDISQSGIKKTFGKNQDNTKMQTSNNLPNIIEESLYLNSSKSTKNNNIIYHYFYSPISVDDNNEMAMITIKEDITNKNDNHKFYYHDIREITNIEKSKAHAMPHNNVSNMLFEQYSPLINNSISQTTKNVKQNTTANNKSIQNNENNTNIQDFGEKIGGARKDLAQPRTITKQAKEVMHDYTVENTDNGYSVDFKGKVLKDGFKTQEAAEKYILDFKNDIKNNRAFVKESNGMLMGADNKYLIYLRNPRTLKSQYIGKSFANKADAESYALALSMYLKEYGKTLFRPQIQKVDRVNANNKNATKATGENILNNFGFRAGEFGNWVKQDERQQFLNYAQDAFNDLAEALNITPESLGQKKAMAIAFGARGQGLTGAVAHFEPVKKVINMTRLKGAGSLAHEYGHSIDNFLSREGGYDLNGMITSNIRNPKLSDRIKNAIREVEDALKYNISTNKEEVDKKNAIYEKNRISNLGYNLSYIDKVFNGEATTYKYNRKTKQYERPKMEVTEKQKNEYKKIRDILIKGGIRGEIDYKISDKNRFKTDKIYPEPINELQKLYKDVVGRKLDDDIVYSIYRQGKPTRQITEVKSESGFSKSALELDRIVGRSAAYFSRTDEMWARAFESYVYDKLKAKGITNTYLVHSVNNDRYSLFNPFPAGEERQNINKAFDNLIQVMKDEGLFETTSNTQTQNDDGVRYLRKGKTKTSNATKNKILKEDIQNTITGVRSSSEVSYKSSNNSIPQNQQNVNEAKKTSDVEPGQTNAERLDAYIEQEIQKIEETASWDNSIPITRRTDIRKAIEDYLGIGIARGHFRQRAYGIYNTNNDTIRSKELKDIDTILHETGHALDIGKRINIDKEKIADELLTAISKVEGYENEPRTIKLEEGFAEIIREYAVLPEQTKAEYPRTVEILEGIRDADKSFDNFIRNIQKQVYNYIHQNPRNRILSNESVGEQTDKIPITKNKIKEDVVKWVWDKDYALKSAVNEISKNSGKEVEASKNAYLLTRLASGVNNKAISMISDGYIDLSGDKTIPGLNRLGEILGNDPERFNDLRSYLLARRDLEYKSKSLKTGLRSTDSEAVIEKFKNDRQIQEAAGLIYDTEDGVLQYAVDNGLITQQNADELRKNAFYVPFQRVLGNNGNQTGRRGAVADIIKKRTGSELDVKDVLENIVVNSANIIQQVENNNVLKALYEQSKEAGLNHHIFEKIPTPLKKVGTAQLSTWENELKKQGIDTDKIDLEKTIDIFSPDNKTDTKNRITSFIDKDGNRVYLQFAEGTEDIFNVIMNLDKESSSKFLKIMSKMNMPLRYGATMANIGFSIPNMISDTAQAAIFSEAGFIPVIDNALGVLDILTANNKAVKNFVEQLAPEYARRVNDLYTMYEQSGATSATRLSQYRKSAQELMKDVYGTKKSETLGIKERYKPLKRLLDLMTYIPELSEQSTRFRVFERNYEAYKNKGTPELEARLKAALESRDATQDFGRTGTFMKEVNQLIPFSAARVGSSYTFAEKVKANPKRTIARIALLTAIAMTIKAIGYKDKEIEELNQRKKDDNFVFKIGDKIITLKKPQGILRSIINLAEYIQDLATGHIEEGKEGKKLGDWIKNAIMDNMPADSISGLVPNAVAPVIENAINKDFYYNTDIVKSYDLDLPNSEQYYDYNSQLAIWLGKIFNYSPAKIDNLISGYFGGLGTQVTNIIDWISGKVGLSAEKPDMGAEQNAVGKRFVVNVNTNSASIDEIYDRKDELTKKKNGGTITDKELEELETITSAITNISKLNKQIKNIKKDLTLSGKDKAELIRPLQEQKTDTARQALGKELIHQENANKIETNQFYPTNDTLKNNGYMLTLTEEMKKEYESLAFETYEKYKQQGLYSEDKLKSIAKDYAKKSLLQKYRDKLVKSN